MRGLHGDNFRNLGRIRDHRPADARDAADDLPRVFEWADEEKRLVPVRDVQAGRSGVDLLALWLVGRGVH